MWEKEPNTLMEWWRVALGGRELSVVAVVVEVLVVTFNRRSLGACWMNGWVDG